MKVSSTSYNNIPPIIENVRVVHPVTCTMLDTVSDLPFSVEKRRRDHTVWCIIRGVHGAAWKQEIDETRDKIQFIEARN